MSYSPGQIQSLWIHYGGNPAAAPMAAAIAMAESRGDPNAENDKNSDGSIDRGLFQINSVHGAMSTKDLATNVRAAIKISDNGRSWHPWSTFNNGDYRSFLGGHSPEPVSAPSGMTSVPGTPGRSVHELGGATLQTVPGVPDQGSAIIDALLHHGKGDLLARIQSDMASGQFMTPDSVRAVNDPSTTQQIPGSPGFTVGGGQGGTLDQILQRMNTVNAAHPDYKWGGGHGSSPAALGTPVDCSGAVSQALGVDPRVSGQFESFGAPGRGQHVTIYAKGSHVIMEVNGHFWGTSNSNPGGGAGWIPRENIDPKYLSGFVARHPNGL